MALNRQSQKDVQDTATYIEDTLKSVSANLGEVFKEAVEAAFDGVDATVMTVATKDFTRAMAAAAKTSEDLVKNHYRISQGLTTSKNLEKQLQTIAERKLELERKYAYTKQLAEDIGKRMTKQQEKAFGDAQAALDLQERILEGDRQSLVDIEKRVGLTGKLVSAISKIPGIGQFLKADEIDQEMRKAAAGGASKFKTMGVAAGMVGKQLAAGLTDPLFLIGQIWSGFMRVNKASVEVQQLTGQYETSIAGVNDRLATSAQFLQTAAELTKQLGVSATLIFAPDQIAQLAEAKNLLGLSAEQAGRMGILMKTTGKSADDIGQGIYDTVNAYNGANKAAVAHGVVLQDVLSASDSITASLGNSEKKIGAAAVAARGLGLSLSEIDAIAGSLLNFEDSIGNELEAQLLTGKNINLSKARELALNNDLEGVANELKKNGASAAEFANMNRIQQESLAKALGMSRDQLAKSVLTQEAMNGMTDEQIAKARGVTLEQSKAMDVQEKMQVGMQKLAEAFAPVLDVIVNLVDALMVVVTPVAKLIATIVGNPIGKYLLLAVVAANFLGVAVSGVGKAFGSMYQLGAKAITGLTGLFKKGNLKEALGELKDKFTGGFKGAASSAAPTAGAGGAASSAATGGKAGGGLMESFSKVNTTALLKGAAAMAVASIGIFIFAKAIQELEKVKDWVNVAIGLGAFAGAMGIIGVVGELAAAGLTALAAGLEALGAAMLTGVGALGLAALIAGAIGLGFALNLATPAIEAYGRVFTAVFAGLTTLVSAVAEGFVKILGAVTLDNIGPMLLLGPALIGVGIGLMTLGVAGLAAFPGILLASLAMSAMVIPLSLLTAVASAGVLPVLITSLMTLGAAAPGLLGVGAGLLSIAAGLAAISIAGPMAIPSLLAVTGLAAVIGGVATIFGGGDKSIGESKSKAEEGSLAAVEAKLTELIAVVKTGGNVYLDSNKVGRAQLMAASSNA